MKNKYAVHYAICPELNNPYAGQCVDTTQLQITSLLVYAASLKLHMKPDFSFRGWDGHNMCYEDYSLEDVVSMHNNTFNPFAVKLVKNIKIQRHKRLGKLVAQSHLVRLTC
jgi:hypothetical protein